MVTTRSAVAVVALLLAVGLSGCGSDQDVVDQDTSATSESSKDAEKPAEPQGAIVESGFGQENEYVFATSVVENKSDHGGQTVTVSFNVKDKAGTVVATENQVESFTGPGHQIAVGTQISLDKGVTAAAVEATLLVEDEGTFKESPVKFDPVPAKVVKDEYGQITARYTVKNPTADPLQDLRIGVTCKDKAGKIIGGGSDFPDLVPPSGEIVVDTDVITSGLPATCMAYPSPGGI